MDFKSPYLEQVVESTLSSLIKVILIRGIQGIGKSALASQVVSYLYYRRALKDGIIFIKIKNASTLVHDLLNWLEVDVVGDVDPVQLLMDTLKDKRVLIVIDQADEYKNEEEDEESNQVADLVDSFFNEKSYNLQ